MGSSSFSQGFLRLEAVGCVALSERTVGGISLIPGIGAPLLIRATMSAKEVGYEGFCSVGGGRGVAGCSFADCAGAVSGFFAAR